MVNDASFLIWRIRIKWPLPHLKSFFNVCLTSLGNGRGKSLTHHLSRRIVASLVETLGHWRVVEHLLEIQIKWRIVSSRILFHGRDNNKILANKAYSLRQHRRWDKDWQWRLQDLKQYLSDSNYIEVIF